MAKRGKSRKGLNLWIINASPRALDDCPQEKSKSQRIAEFMTLVADKQKDVAEIYVTNLHELSPIGPCKGCVSTVASLCHYPCDCYPNIKYPKDPMLELYKIGEKADIIIFVTPVHWMSYSSHMSLFFGRLTCIDGGRENATNKDKNYEIKLVESGKFKPKKHWAGKIAGIYTISDSTTGAAEPLALSLGYMGLWVPPHCIVEEVMGGYVPYHKHNELFKKTECIWNDAKQLVLNLIEAAKITRERKIPRGGEECMI